MKAGFGVPAMALMGATLASCSDIGPADPSPPLPRIDVQGVVVDTNDVGSIFLDVRLPRAARVRVRYWPADAGDTLTISAAEMTDEGKLLLARLMPSRVYRYDVTAINAAGVSGSHIDGEFRSSPLPSELESVQFTVTGVQSSPLSMVELNGTFRGVAIIDRSGTPVWWWRSQGGPQGVTRRANGNFVVNDAGYGLFEISPDGHVVHALDVTNDPTLAPLTHHDVLPTADNTILFIAQDARTLGDSTVTGDAIWEWTPETGTVVKRTSVFDFLDPARDVGTHSTSKDWVHANSLSYGNHGNLILSLNWLNEIVSIAPGYEKIEWTLGGSASNFVLDADALFQGQHTAQQLANGHVFMFDNGRDREGAARSSRALELVLDPRTRTARQVWSFTPSPAIYAPYVGSARRLANGNSVVHFGTAEGYRGATGPISTYEVAPDGRVIWRLVIANMGGVDISYRSEPIASVAGEATAP